MTSPSIPGALRIARWCVCSLLLWCVLVAASTSPWKQPRSLRIGDLDVKVKRATLLIRVETERWSAAQQAWLYEPEGATAEYVVEVEIDRRSLPADWRDQELEPVARISMEPRTAGRFALPHDLVGDTIGSESGWDAWLASDLPELEDNVLRVFGYELPYFTLQWSARWEDEAFEYRGPAVYQSVRIAVKDPADAPIFLEAVFGAEAASELLPKAGRWIDYGESMPPERRLWWIGEFGVPYTGHRPER